MPDLLNDAGFLSVAEDAWLHRSDSLLALLCIGALAVIFGQLRERRQRQRLIADLEHRLTVGIRAAVRGTVQSCREEIEAATVNAGDVLDERALRLALELSDRSGELDRDLSERQNALARKLQHEAQSLAEGLASDVERVSTTRHNHVVEAAGRLSTWITRLKPVLQRVTGEEPEGLPSQLPEPAGREWKEAWSTLRQFEDQDLPDLKRLVLSCDGEDLEESLRRHLEPFDHAGRLGQVTLALQYLLEAFPVEQLSSEKRNELRRELHRAVCDAGLEEDFHALVGAVASGIGLEYRPVSYYRSRLDEANLAFVRQQVSPISLSDRVGFAATAEPSVVVRLGRPFFYQAKSNVYYAGHAHVARD